MRDIYTALDLTGINSSPPEFLLAGGGGGAYPPRTQKQFATPFSDNLLKAPSDVARRVTKHPGRVLLWSGRCEPDPEDEAMPSPQTWSPGAWAGFNEFCRAAAAELSATTAALETRICFLPRAGDVLSDLPSCQRFLNHRSEWAGSYASRFEILLDPIGMLTPGMLAYAAEHMERIMLGLGQMSGVAGIVLSNVAAGGGAVERLPVHQGAIPDQLLRSFLHEFCSVGIPVLLMNRDVPAQLELLRVGH